MRLARARRVRSPPILLGWPHNSAPQTAAPASVTGDGSPAQTTLFPSRFHPTVGKSNPSPPPSESAGLLPLSSHAPPQFLEIRSAWSILHAAADFPAVTPAAAPPAAPAASNAPGPPASAENQTRLPSLPPRLLPRIRTPSARAPVSLHRPAWSRAKRPDPRPLASSNP